MKDGSDLKYPNLYGGDCMRCGSSDMGRVIDHSDTPLCNTCGWCPPYQIEDPSGRTEGISPSCQDHKYNCFGAWSEWPFDIEGRMYYQLECICPCHEGQPRGMDLILSWYKDNPDELKAIKGLMPTFGDTFEEMVNDHDE